MTGLTNGTGYKFRVSATNVAGTGDPSTPSELVTPRAKPEAPVSVVGSPGDQQVVVSWSKVELVDNGGSAITGYKVEYSSDAGVSWTTAVAASAPESTVYTVTGLTNGTAYKFRVSATNVVGTGDPSTPAAATPAAAVTEPGAPTEVDGTPGDGRVTLSWTAPTNTGGSAITEYTVTATPGGSTCTTALTSCIVVGLDNGTAYTFSVVATNTAGDGVGSAEPSVTPYTLPGAPTEVGGTPGDGQVALSWSKVELVDNGGSAITGYKVEYSSDAGETWSTPVTVTATTFVVTGLTNGTGYVFQVSATNAAGTGDPSTSSELVTPRTKPEAPVIASASPGDQQVALSWTAGGNNGSVVTDWVVEYSSDAGVSWTTFDD